MSAYTYTAAGADVEEVDGFEGGHGTGSVRGVALDGLAADWKSLRFVTLHPGSSLGPRRLHTSEVILYVTRGTVTAELPGRRAPLEVGGCLALPVGAQLELMNDSDVDAEIVMAELGAH